MVVEIMVRLFQGKRGGVYYYDRKGNKVYVKRGEELPDGSHYRPRERKPKIYI